jgi:hypothetical protein
VSGERGCGRNRRGGSGPEFDGNVVLGEIPGGEVGAGVRITDGDKKAGSLKAEGGEAGVGGGYRGDLLGLIQRVGGLGDGERDRMAVDEGDGGSLAVGEFDGEAEAEARAAEVEFVLAHLVEETRAVAEHDGGAHDGVPNHVAKAAQAGEGEADLVPIGVQGEAVWSADGLQALGGEGDDAGISGVELDGLTGQERGVEGDGGLVQLAGVVGVGVDGGCLKRNVVGVDANALPVERGGDLQRNMGERGDAVVADGDESANGDLLVCRAKMDVEIKGGEGHLWHLRWGQLAFDDGRCG